MKWLLLLLALAGCSVAHAEETDVEGGTAHRIAGWSQTGTLRIYNVSVGTPLDIRFPEVGNYTLQFNIGSIAGNPRGPKATADIDWSVGGVRIHRRITVIDGASITGVANGVTVRVVDSTPATGIAPVNTQYNCDIAVAKGTRGSNKQPPFLAIDSQTLLNPGDTVAIAVPQNVGAVSMLAEIGPAAGSIFPVPPFSVVANVASAMSAVSVPYDATLGDWRPLPPGAYSINYLVDPGLPGPIGITTYLGIDG